MILPPLVVAFLAFLAGLLPALRFSPPPFPFLLVATAALAAAAVLATAPHRPDRLIEMLIVAAFTATGGAFGAARAVAPDCRLQIPDGAVVRVVGLLGAGVFPREYSDGPPLLPLEQATLHAGEQRCKAAVRTILPGDAPAALAGSTVSFTARWHRSRRQGPDTGWPVDGFRAGYLRAAAEISLEAPNFAAHPLLTLRGRSEAHLHQLFPRHFAMVEALLLGRRERLDPVVRDRFARAGLSHLLAISGSHVAVFAAVLVVIGGVLRMPRKRITWTTIVLVGVYLSLIGAPASAVRAGAMVSLVLLALLLQRPSAVLPIAAAACLLIVALEPIAILDVGLQLSFAGVFGIIAAQRTLGRRLARATRGTAWKWIADTTLVSAAAFLATAPITAYQFGTVAPIAILANLPAIPLSSLALVGVLAAAGTAPLRPVAELLAAGAGLALDLLDRVATLAASVPYGSTAVDRGDLLAWGLATAGGGAILFLFRHGRRGVRMAVATGTGCTALLVWPVVAHAPARGLEIHFIDVGQGDAIALRTPRGRWLLVDAGPGGGDFDAGERRVVPFFRARGVNDLEAMILTHPHADHIGGALAVLREMRVERVIEPGLPVGDDLYLQLLEGVRAEEAAWLAARGGRVLRLDGIELDFLWPEPAVLMPDVDPNDVSAVAVLHYGEFSLLLSGDASSEVEAELLRRYGDRLEAEVLKAGHHGSSTSTSADFLQVVDPELVVISAGRGNRYGHPAPLVLARLRAAGVEIARTDRDGTISLRVRGEEATEAVRIGE